MLIQRMHQYVLGWIGIFVAFVVTFPIAMSRVSQTPKFTGQAVKSLECNGKTAKIKGVVSWTDTCSQMQVEPLKKH
jgi:hypothetical protein